MCFTAKNLCQFRNICLELLVQQKIYQVCINIALRHHVKDLPLHTYISKLKNISTPSLILYDQVFHIFGHFNQLILLNYSLQSPELTYKNNKKKFQPYHLVVHPECPERNDVALGELDVVFHIIPYSHLIIEERFPHVPDIGFSA